MPRDTSHVDHVDVEVEFPTPVTKIIIRVVDRYEPEPDLLNDGQLGRRCRGSAMVKLTTAALPVAPEDDSTTASPVEQLLVENARLRARVDMEGDPCKAIAAFPTHIEPWQIRRWCRESVEADQQGLRPHFACWQENGRWFVDKVGVDAFLLRQGIRPVDAEKSVFSDRAARRRRHPK